MEDQTRGTVTSLSSLFPVDEAQKAAKRVEDAIAEKQKELNHLKEFISDNTNLVNLVSRLPDELHHDVMVPFGKAAFFPGQLVHTNEFMVLLGEGYYVERTAKQTVEILKRRGKVLDSQVESLKTNIKDLRAEASFFNFTAHEAAEGLVEIQEEYVEESSDKGKPKSEMNDKKVMVEDDEYARMMARLDELEKEELAGEGDNENYEDESTSADKSENDNNEDQHTNDVEYDDESDEYDPNEADIDHLTSQTTSETRKLRKLIEAENASGEALSRLYDRQLNINDQPNCTGLTVQPLLKDHMSSRESLGETKKSIPSNKSPLLPVVDEKVKTVSSLGNKVPLQTRKSEFDSSKAVTDSIMERPGNIQNLQDRIVTPSQTPKWTSKEGFDSSKAFTGSIVEHAFDLPNSQQKNAASSQSSNPQPSKPVSRFKMQRR